MIMTKLVSKRFTTPLSDLFETLFRFVPVSQVADMTKHSGFSQEELGAVPVGQLWQESNTTLTNHLPTTYHDKVTYLPDAGDRREHFPPVPRPRSKSQPNLR